MVSRREMLTGLSAAATSVLAGCGFFGSGSQKSSGGSQTETYTTVSTPATEEPTTVETPTGQDIAQRAGKAQLYRWTNPLAYTATEEVRDEAALEQTLAQSVMLDLEDVESTASLETEIVDAFGLGNGEISLISQHTGNESDSYPLSSASSLTTSRVGRAASIDVSPRPVVRRVAQAVEREPSARGDIYSVPTKDQAAFIADRSGVCQTVSLRESARETLLFELGQGAPFSLDNPHLDKALTADRTARILGVEVKGAAKYPQERIEDSERSGSYAAITERGIQSVSGQTIELSRTQYTVGEGAGSSDIRTAIKTFWENQQATPQSITVQQTGQVGTASVTFPREDLSGVLSGLTY